MNWLRTILILAAGFAAVFWQAAFPSLRHWLGAQVDLLPPLMVYAALSSGLMTAGLLAFCGGLWLDALSANPLGVSVLPLLFIGLALGLKRELILREEPFAQLSLGLAASALAPPLTLGLLLTLGHAPLLGWGSLWQWLVMSAGGALATPLVFVVFGWLEGRLAHARAVETSFRPDREIRRGRS